jgi:protein phosphatase 2C family protein 2/3
MIPQLFDRGISFMGVFDGTSGHEASDFVSKHIDEYFCKTSEVKEVLHLSKAKKNIDPVTETVAMLLNRALIKTFRRVDRDLITLCEEKELNYVASTGVTAVLWKNLLTIAHIGDSRACIFKKIPSSSSSPEEEGDDYIAEWLTVDHKPNSPNELSRIRKAGGILSYKGNKPYMREGDYLARQADGERPKQLNYSRAFGAKNLKKFGLISEPELNHFKLTDEDVLVVLASDGLWDTFDPATVLGIALEAKADGLPISETIISKAIEEMPNKGIVDNISVISIFLS